MSARTTVLLGLLGLVALRAPLAGATEVVPVGAEFRVSAHGDTYNYPEDGYGRDPRIAYLAGGGFVVVWAGHEESSTIYIDRLFGRRLDAAAAPQGGQFIIDPGDGYQGLYFRPSVAADAQGGFVVVWGNLDYDVAAQRFDAAAQPRGPAFTVNTDTAETRTLARHEVATDPQGGFLVAWQDGYHGDDIVARRYDANDAPLGAPFSVPTGISGHAYDYPSVAADAQGQFVVVWNGGTAMYAQRVDPAGALLGTSFQVSSHGTDEDVTHVAAAPGGNFMAVNPDFSTAHVFDAGGNALGPEFSFDAGGNYSGVTADADGNFIVVWQGGNYVWTRRFDGTGQALGATVTTVNQSSIDGVSFNSPQAAADANGDFVVVWSNYYYPSDTQRGIFARRFAVCGDGRLGWLPCDDGNTTALDGCSARCAVETCGTCGGEPSSCSAMPGCDTVCSDAAPIENKAILTIKKILAPAGDESITFRGRILDPPVAAGAYSPAVDGAEVVLTGTGVLYQRATPTAIPPGLAGTGCGLLDGWKVSGRAPNFSYTYKNLTNALPPACLAGSANGLRVAKLKDKIAKNGTIEFQVTVKNATLPPVPAAPVTATLVLGQSPGAGSAGKCARIRFGSSVIANSTARYYP